MANKKKNAAAPKAAANKEVIAAPKTEEKAVEVKDVPVAPKAEVKAEAPAVKPAVKEEAPKKEAKEPAPKKEVAAKKEPAPKKEAAAKKEPAPKKEAAPKAAKKDEKASTVVLQFNDKEYDMDKIVEDCKAAYRAANPKKQIRSINVYVKPADNKAYYVINNRADGYFIEL